jgi:hypothetical protein
MGRESSMHGGKEKCTAFSNIKADLKHTGWEGVDGIHLAQKDDDLRALVNTR